MRQLIRELLLRNPALPPERIGEVAIAAPLPRPEGFRTTPAFREAAETISRLLAAAMEAA